jgi:hypothetical protein
MLKYVDSEGEKLQSEVCICPLAITDDNCDTHSTYISSNPTPSLRTYMDYTRKRCRTLIPPTLNRSRTRIPRIGLLKKTSMSSNTYTWHSSFRIQKWSSSESRPPTYPWRTTENAGGCLFMTAEGRQWKERKQKALDR